MTIARDRVGLFRPIEITDDEKDYSITGTGAVSISTGVYGALPMLLWEMTDTSGAAYTWTLDADNDYRVKVVGSAGNFSVTWTDTNLRDILGFAALDINGASDSYTATYYPQYTFVPTYARSDRGFFSINHGRTSPGTTAADGNYTSIKASPTRRECSLEFPLESASRLANEFATWAANKNANWETFLDGARTAQPSVAANPSTNGCYFFPDVDDAVSGIQSMDSGGVDFALSSSADTYVWCSIGPGTPPAPKIGTPSSRLYYNIGVDLITAEAPTWVTLS